MGAFFVTKSTLFNEVVSCKPDLELTDDDTDQVSRYLVLSKNTIHPPTKSSNQSIHPFKSSIHSNHSNNQSTFNYNQQIQLKQSLITYLVTDGWNFAITLTFNRTTTHKNAQKKLAIWNGRLNKKLYGPKWRERNKSVFFYAFPEKIDSNYHYHLLCRVDKDLIEKVYFHSPIIWKKLVRSSECHIKKLITDQAQADWVEYITKELWNKLNYDNFVISEGG